MEEQNPGWAAFLSHCHRLHLASLRVCSLPWPAGGLALQHCLVAPLEAAARAAGLFGRPMPTQLLVCVFVQPGTLGLGPQLSKGCLWGLTCPEFHKPLQGREPSLCRQSSEAPGEGC